MDRPDVALFNISMASTIRLHWRLEKGWGRVGAFFSWSLMLIYAAPYSEHGLDSLSIRKVEHYGQVTGHRRIASESEDDK